MSKKNKPKFKIYSKLGVGLTDHPKISGERLSAKKWQTLYSDIKRPRKESEYGTMLSAKQRLNLFYGQIKEKQFHNLYKKAKFYEGNQTMNFVKLLERRLDVILFRAKVSPSFHEIRQFIQHGHVKVNNRIVKTSSFLLKKNDSFSFKRSSRDFIKSKSKTYLSKLVKSPRIKKPSLSTSFFTDNSILFTPNYLEFNYDLMIGKLTDLPRETSICFPMNPKLTNIMEYYKYKKKT